ncbi:MAG: DUF2339 domain-containing protein, partial [Gammaproteobacteria bacterium]
MEWILLLGLIALFFVQSQQARRLARLEEELQWLSSGKPREPEGTAAAKPAAAVADEAARPALPPRELAAWLARSPPPPPRWNGVLGDKPLRGDAEEAAAGEDRGSFGDRFERLVAGRLLVWIAGIAFAVGGVLLVRYSIERGWATPPVRMIMAAIFGYALLAAGEIARGRPGSK